MGAKFLFWEVKRHDGGLSLVRGLEFVEMSWGKDIPKSELVFIPDKRKWGVSNQPAV